MCVHACACVHVHKCVHVLCVCMCVYSKRGPVLASSNLTDEVQLASPFHPHQIQVLAPHQVGSSDVLLWESMSDGVKTALC